MTPSVLLVEDEDPLAILLEYNLGKDGFRVERAVDGEQAMRRIGESTPDLILLDWMLPKMSGLEVLRQLRSRDRTKHTPIIMLTARNQETDKVRALDTGVDDYVVKPFTVSELAARMRALLRRTRPELFEDQLAHADLVFDRSALRVTRAGTELRLSPTELRLLEFLMQRPGRVFSRERLLDAIWGGDASIEPRNVDVHMGRLRRALHQAGAPDLIRTVRSAGYALGQR